MNEPKRGKCSMCGETFLYVADKPPCTIYYLGKDWKAELCYNCAVRTIQFIKTYRQQRRWKDMIV